ncbi:glycosyltransferase [Halovivax sp.]|uniref:glycosyltransferase family 2 protein n=1 Tax=Halovivax sp. TaxID=1935978 RepID=UPI0025BC3ACE|nr:glycosyltransferase family 2 protein [Halovivax sp.]
METGDPDASPLVSVVLPTYDRPRMLVEAVESVAAQAYPNLELLVVDDGSPTPAATILEERAPSALEWRCLRHDENRGANAARNTGIRAAAGEYVAFLDDDDRWSPETVASQVAALWGAGERAGVALVGQRTLHGDDETAIRLPTIEGEATGDLMAGEPAGTFSTMLVRRSVVDDAGLPDERFPALQDREWMIRLSRHCEFVSVREPLVERRFGDYEQIDDAFEPKRDTTHPLFLEKHRELAAEHGRERQFRAWLATTVAGTGLTNGHYGDARRFALRAIRSNPRARRAYVYLALALGGHLTYRSAVRFARFTRGLQTKFWTEPT